MKEHHVPHHFSSARQAYESSKLGLWVFLVTEILLFGGLFVAYIIFRALYSETFIHAHHFLNRSLGATNTVVLLLSSLTMALAVAASKEGRSKATANYLLVTFLCGGTFMVIKGFEYAHKIHEGLLPGLKFTNTEFTDPHGPLFFSLYFMMTGLHGIHVLAGMSLIGWLYFKARRQAFNHDYYTPVELTGLYWHLVDLVWIYLFPLFYLIG